MSDDSKKWGKPHMRLHALSKSTRDTKRVGAAWVKEDGSISIKLDPFVILQNVGNDLVLSLFKEDK